MADRCLLKRTRLAYLRRLPYEPPPLHSHSREALPLVQITLYPLPEVRAIFQEIAMDLFLVPALPRLILTMADLLSTGTQGPRSNRYTHLIQMHVHRTNFLQDLPDLRGASDRILRGRLESLLWDQVYTKVHPFIRSVLNIPSNKRHLYPTSLQAIPMACRLIPVI